MFRRITPEVRSALVALLIAACAHYRQPEPTEPHALLELRKGEVPVSMEGIEIVGVGWTSSYSAYDNQHCESSSNEVNLGVLGTFTGEESVRVVPGKGLFILARMTVTHQMALTPISHSEFCDNMVSFVPEPGRVYELRQSLVEGGCALSVIDTGTGEPPASLARHAALCAN